MTGGLFAFALVVGSLESVVMHPANALTARDMAATAGLSYFGLTQGRIPVFHANDDKLRDILLSTHANGPWKLMRNQGNGTFALYLPDQFKKYDRHGCVAADFGSPTGNLLPDGKQDVYCTVGACEGTCTKEFPNELWLRKADGTFVNVSRAWGVADVHGRGRDIAVLDANKDGRPDLALANEASSTYFSSNLLFINRGGRFEDVLGAPFRKELGSECVTSFVKQNGYPDLFFCAAPNLAGGAGTLTYRNNNGTFQDVTATTAYRGLKARDIEFADLNGDHRSDLIIVTFTKVSVWLNVNDGFPQESFSYPLKEGHDAVACNINNDAAQRPDLYVVQGKNKSLAEQYPDLVLLNNGTGKAFTLFTGLPQTKQGDGDIATCIPNWNGTAYPAILVTNGKWLTQGPNQLIVFSAN